MNGISALRDVEDDILKLASAGTALSFSVIQKHFGEKASKATVSKYLKLLVKDGFLEERAGGADVRFRPRYMITDKGRSILLARKTDQIIEGLTSILALEKVAPGTLEEWRRAASEEQKVTSPFKEIGVEEFAKACSTAYNKPYVQLDRAYRVFHKLFCELHGIGGMNMFLGFDGKGQMHMIDAETLKKHGLPLDPSLIKPPGRKKKGPRL